MKVEEAKPSLGWSAKSGAFDIYTTCKNQIDILWAHQCRDVELLTKDLAKALDRNAVLVADLDQMTSEREELFERSALAAAREEELVRKLDDVTIEKDLGDLVLDQYRDQVTEYRSALDSKQEALDLLERGLEQANAELAELARESTYYRQTIAVGEEALAHMRLDLEANAAEVASLKFQNGCLSMARSEALHGYMMRSPMKSRDVQNDGQTEQRSSRANRRRRAARRSRRTRAHVPAQ